MGIKIKEGKVETSTITANIENLQTKMPISVEGTSPDTVDPNFRGEELTLFSVPIPGAGFTLGDIVVGATIELPVRFELGCSGKFSVGVTFEGNAVESRVEMDLLNKDNNKFDKSAFKLKKPKWSLRELTNPAKITASLALKASLGLKFGVGEARAQVKLPIPEVSLELKPTIRK